MSASPEFVDFAQELFAPLGGVSIRRMFGGAGLYCRGLMFGLIHDETISLKADAERAKAFDAHGCGPFTYEGKGKPVQMSNWRSEEHTSEIQSIILKSYADICLKQKQHKQKRTNKK